MAIHIDMTQPDCLAISGKPEDTYAAYQAAREVVSRTVKYVFSGMRPEFMRQVSETIVRHANLNPEGMFVVRVPKGAEVPVYRTPTIYLS